MANSTFGSLPLRVLVTVSSGFIGTHLVKTLLTKGKEVCGLNARLPVAPVAGFRLEQCDILAADSLAKVLADYKPQAIIHLAARTDLYGKDMPEYAANVEGVRNLLIAVGITPSVSRGIYTSSQLVCRLGYVPKDDHEYCPNTLYGESKVLTEEIVEQQDGGGKKWCPVRPTTVWGAGRTNTSEDSLFGGL